MESLIFGTYGLVADKGGIISAHQIETARRILSRNIKKTGKIWIKIFPKYGITKKPDTTRMGKGKGEIKFWICKIRPGKILFEVEGTNRVVMLKVCRLISFRLSMNVKLLEFN